MLVKQSEYVLDTICKNGLVEFSRRDIMRLCRTFKTADSIQSVLNHLVDYGYLAVKSNDAATIKGRPTGQVYLVNPYIAKHHRVYILLSFLSFVLKVEKVYINMKK